VAPFLLGQVLVETEPAFGNPLVGAPWVRGIDPRYETNVSVLATSLVAGTFDLDGRSVLIGSEFARGMRLNVGDHLAVYSPRQLQELKRRREQRETADDRAVLADDYTVGGIFDVGYYEYNANIVITSLENAQDLYALEGQAHGLLVMLKDPFQAERIRAELFQALPPDCSISLWTQDNSSILEALVVEKNVMFIIFFVVMIVAAFGIMGTLIAFVVHKTREIGILKAIGGTNLQVMALFLIKSFFVGGIGIGAGYAIAMVSLAYRNNFLHAMRQWTGLELFPASIYGFSELPALILARDVALICGSALLACVLAGLLPAMIAARLQPVDALRHE
jgi:lipoprotein-releasing system permease protein